MRKLSLLSIIIVVGYIVIPTLSNMAADQISKNRPAPWEDVVGLYFPTGSNGPSVESPRFGTLQQCKNWAGGMQSIHYGYGRGGNSSWVCGWGSFIRADDKTGLPKMRDFIQGE